MQNIRIIKIPQLKVVSSGAITNMEEFEAFDKWWSEIDVSHYITPRDFMWYNEKENAWNGFLLYLTIIATSININ